MFDSMKAAFGRRDLFRSGGLLAAAQALLGGRVRVRGCSRQRPANFASARISTNRSASGR